MNSSKVPWSPELLEIKDIVSCSADAIMQNIYKMVDKPEYQVIYVLCYNLYRVERYLELELADDGIEAKSRTYNSLSLTDINYLDFKVGDVIETIVDEGEDN